jgi:hypothetical protein
MSKKFFERKGWDQLLGDYLLTEKGSNEVAYRLSTRHGKGSLYLLFCDKLGRPDLDKEFTVDQVIDELGFMKGWQELPKGPIKNGYRDKVSQSLHNLKDSQQKVNIAFGSKDHAKFTNLAVWKFAKNIEDLIAMKDREQSRKEMNNRISDSRILFLENKTSEFRLRFPKSK